MVQIAISFVVALLLVTPGIAAPFAIEQTEDIDSRDLTELAPRRFHFHPGHFLKTHINANQVLGGLEKYGPGIGKQALKMAGKHGMGEKAVFKGLKRYGPGIGKQAFKMAKMFLREDIGEGHSLIARDMDPMDELHELLARSPRRSVEKLLKAAKEGRKFVKDHHKEFGMAMDATGMFGRSLEGPEIDARELDFHLEILERALTDWVAMDERDFHANIFDRDLEDSMVYERDYEHEIYEREAEESLEDYFGRDYDDFGLEELD
jgi:hypothetical protein